MVECDIMPLRDCHLILGRAWQYDNCTMYDAYRNVYQFSKDGTNFILNHMREEDDPTWHKTRSLGLVERIAFREHKNHQEEDVEEADDAAVHNGSLVEEVTPSTIEGEVEEVYSPFSGFEHQMHAEVKSEQQRVEEEPYMEKVLEDEQGLEANVAGAHSLYPDDGVVE